MILSSASAARRHTISPVYSEGIDVRTLSYICRVEDRQDSRPVRGRTLLCKLRYDNLGKTRFSTGGLRIALYQRQRGREAMAANYD